MKERKFIGAGKKCLLGTALLLATSGFAVLGSCSEESVTGYTVPTNTTVEVGALYTPDFALQNDVKATIVKLQAPSTSKAYVQEDSFIPDVVGEYTYIVRFSQPTAGVKDVEERVTIKAVDTTAPVIGAIADKEVEIGEYTSFAEDLANITVADNCAQLTTVYAESIVYNGQTTTLGKDVKSFTLPVVGEYTVNVVAEDFSGNKSKKSYKLNAVDTTAPVISSPNVAIAWAKNGKVTLPTPNVIDVANCTVVATLKDADGEEIVYDQASNTANLAVGVYTIEYEVKDTSDNSAKKTVKLIVNQSGVVSDFNEADEDQVWSAYGLRIAGGSLGIYDKRSNTASLQYTEGFVVGDWSGYVSFEAEMKNNTGSYLSVTPYFLVDGVWKETAMQKINANATATVKVYLEDYDITKVDGVKFVYGCDAGIDALVNSVKVVATADDRTFPSDGYTRYGIGANASREISVNEQANYKGVVKFGIYSSVACDIMTTLKYANGSVISSHSLQVGYNEITRYPDAEAGKNLIGSVLESLVISNVENYDVKLYVANTFTYESVSSIDINAYARTEGAFTVNYNESFAIPSPFTSSLRWYQGLTVALKKNGTTVKQGLTIGDLLYAGNGGLATGDYEIVYSFKDLASASKTITYSLEVKQNVLTATLAMPTLFASTEDFELPDPVITSTVYGDATVQQGATVNKYYRLLGKNSWTKAVNGEPFMPVPNKTYEIRYTIEYQGEYREIYEQKFIHNDAYTLDFEQDESLTEEIAYMEEDPANPGTWIKVRQRYLYDGGIYAYKTTRSDIFLLPTDDWSKSGKQSLTVYSMVEGATTILIRPLIANDKGINAISFWMKSDRAVSNFYVNIGIGAADGDRPYVKNGWRSSEPFNLLQGEHFYTVYLKEPILPFETIGAFGMVMPYAVRMYIDDVQFRHLDRLEIEDTNKYENQLDHKDGYELTKPTPTSDDLTAEELAQVSYVLTYSLNGKDEIEIKPDKNGKYVLKLAEDEYGEVQFKWTVSTPNKWSSEGGVITRTATSPVVMIKAVRLAGEHEEVVKQDTDIKLNAPTVSEGEIVDGTVTLEYNSTGEWKQMPKADGKFVLPTQTYGWYQLRYTADVKISDTLTVKGVAMSEIYVRNKYVLVDYEGSDPYLGGVPYFNSPTGGKGPIPGSELEYDKETRNTVQKILVVNDSSEGVLFEKPFVFEEAYNIINVKLHASRALTNYSVYITAGMTATTMKWQEFFIDLEAGWNDVYIECPEFKAFSSFTGRMLSDFGSVKIDDISLLSIEFSAEIPEIVYYGEETTLPTATLKGVQSSVAYRLKGTTDWTNVVANKFNPETLGTYEVRFAFDGVSEMIKEISVELNSEELKNFPTSAKSGDTITVPTLKAGEESSTAFYREKGVEEWTAVSSGSFVAEKSGAYEVKFYFEGIDAFIVKTITVTPANEFLLTDFETPFEADGKDTYYTTSARVYMYPYSPDGTEENKVYTGVLKSLYSGLGSPTTLYDYNDDGTGNHVFHMVNASGYDGPYWLGGGIEFGFTTNTFKFRSNATASKLKHFYITWWDEKNKKYELSLDDGGLSINWDTAESLGNGWYDYTITMTESTDRVSAFSFWTGYYDVDDIRAIDTSKS